MRCTFLSMLIFILSVFAILLLDQPQNILADQKKGIHSQEMLEQLYRTGGNQLSVSQNDSLNVRVVGRWPYGSTNAIAIDEERGLTFQGSGGGIYVLDTTNPPAPEKLAEFATPGIVENFHYSDGLLYVADGPGGMRIISFDNPHEPIEVGYYCVSLEDNFKDLKIKDTYAYTIEDWYGYFRIISVSDVSNPIEVGNYFISGDTGGIAVADSYAYIANGSAGLLVMDISNPENPQRVGNYFTSYWVYDVFIDEDYAYIVTNSDGFRVLSISDPVNPTEIGHLPTTRCKGLDVRGTYAYLSGGGLYVISIGDPANPVQVGYYDSPSDYEAGVIADDSYVYLPHRYYGMDIISIINPAYPNKIGSHNTPGFVTECAISDSLIYVVDNSNDVVRIISESNLPTLAEVGNYNMNQSGIRAIVIEGDYAYIGGYQFHVLSLEDPLNLIEVGRYDPFGTVLDIAIDDTLAYIVCRSGGPGESSFRIVSISNPYTPDEIGFCYVGDYADNVDIKDSYAYVAEHREGLIIISIMDPQNPVVVGSCSSWGGTEDVSISGTYAYLVKGEQGLWVIDISNPMNPNEVGNYNTSGNAASLMVCDSLAYVADKRGGIIVISVINPTNPRKTGYYNTPEIASKITVSGDNIYTSIGQAGLLICNYFDQPTFIDPKQPDAYRREFSLLSQNYPNPFNPTTMISFDIPGEAGIKQHALLTVYDLRGRHVITLIDEALEPGTHQVVWDGKDEQGQQVSSGIYLYTLKSGNSTYTKKMVMVK